MTEKIEYRLVRSKRKTVSMSMDRNGALLVRAPLRMPVSAIDEFVGSHRSWIEKHRKKLAQSAESLSQAGMPERLSEDETEGLYKAASLYFAEKTARFAKIMGLSYGRITIRLQKTRWGSCSAKKNLNFNCLLMLCPEEVRQYVIVHELCHLKHMDHSQDFWDMVALYCPDYRVLRKWLKDNGEALLRRVF